MPDETPPEERRRRKSDSQKHRVFKWTGLTMLGAGASLPIVTFLGYTALWIIEITRALNGLPAVDLPGPPWDTWEAIASATVLTLIGGFLYTTTDTAGGRKIVRSIVNIGLARGQSADVRVSSGDDDEDDEEEG